MDIVYVGGIVLLFVVTVILIVGCEKLGSVK